MLALPAAALVFAGVVLAFQSEISGISIRKGNLRFYAKVMLAAALFFYALELTGKQLWTPVARVKGKIINVSCVAGRKQPPYTLLSIKPSSGFAVDLNAEGTNPRFRLGENVEITYEMPAGTIQRALFFSSVGSIEGEYSESRWWQVGVLMILGFALLIAAHMSRRQDPMGEEEQNRSSDDAFRSTAELVSFVPGSPRNNGG